MPGLKTRQRFWEATGRQAGRKVRAGRRRESFFKKERKGGEKKELSTLQELLLAEFTPQTN